MKRAGLISKTACLTCINARDDDCKVCDVCCACCTCVPKKKFAKCAHFYSTGAEPEEVATQYTECKHGFVLVQGTVDDSLQQQCTRPECVSSAVEPPEAVDFAATVQQLHSAVVPGANSAAAAAGEAADDGATVQQRHSTVVPVANSAAAAAGEGVDEPTFADDEPFYDAPVVNPESAPDGEDYVRENLCTGCDCEFHTREQLDNHGCSDSEVNGFKSSSSSDEEPMVPAVVPTPVAQPLVLAPVAQPLKGKGKGKSKGDSKGKSKGKEHGSAVHTVDFSSQPGKLGLGGRFFSIAGAHRHQLAEESAPVVSAATPVASLSPSACARCDSLGLLCGLRLCSECCFNNSCTCSAANLGRTDVVMAVGADTVLANGSFSDPVHKGARCVNCDGTFMNVGMLVEHHKKCLVGSGVACYAGTTTPITMRRPEPVKLTCMVCDAVVDLDSIRTYKLGPKAFCSRNCEVDWSKTFA